MLPIFMSGHYHSDIMVGCYRNKMEALYFKWDSVRFFYEKKNKVSNVYA